MTTSNTKQKLLLLADNVDVQQTAACFEPFDITICSNPYVMLATLNQNNYSGVVIHSPREDMGELTRAISRISRRINIIATCPIECMQEMSDEGGYHVDRVISSPPVRAEVAAMARELRGESGSMSVNAHQVNQLIMADSRASLETILSQIVSTTGNLSADWVDRDEIAESTPLLAIYKGNGRFLVTTESNDDHRLDSLLADLYITISSLELSAMKIESLNRLAVTDHLTGVYNRRYLYHLADNILERAKKENFRVSLLLYDIDDFKSYNDKFGHALGDKILKETAVMIKDLCREQDIVARIGGDEFVVLFWDNEIRQVGSEPLTNAFDLSNRFRQGVESIELKSLGTSGSGPLTISGGLATYSRDGQTCSELLASADKALRDAKQTGKNSIHLVP